MFNKVTIKIYIQKFEQLEDVIKKIEEVQKKCKNIEVIIEIVN